MITKIINSLNQLEVKGKQNLDILLGCILALEEIEKQINTPKQAQKSEDEVEENNG